MPHSARKLALLTVFLVGSAGSGSALAKKRLASLDGRLCSKFSQHVDREARGIVFSIENRCAEQYKCTITWTTRCAREASVAHDDEATLEGGASKDFEAVSGCDTTQAWEVSAATWSCKPVSQSTAQK